MGRAAVLNSERSRARHREILNEAMRIVGEKGYYGFGLQELADRCGVTKAGLLHYVGSKEQLLLSLLEDRDAANERAALALVGARSDALAQADDRRERLLEALVAIVCNNAKQAEATRLQVVLRAEAINREHPAHRYFHSREASKQTLLAEALEGIVSVPTSTARAIISLISGLEEEWLREDQAFDLVEESRRALRALMTP
ncbi:helix-turn-helix domain-containing protein (plasmid) [Novosphingobium sp. BL-8A]|uniref:TetR/AcrR family transcriptional regulator n=1 Tax=Novosphingobium sp. BL-8A TaxID=3127639 RepID=UPI003757FEE7